MPRQKAEKDEKPARELPPGAKAFSRTGEGLTSFVEGEEIKGKFIHMKEVEIKDRRTKEKKMIRVYVIEQESGEIARVGSRALLDDAFDELVSTIGGIEHLQGKTVSFNRGEDVQTGDGNPLGTYEIILY
jgi:hypothetical protein